VSELPLRNFGLSFSRQDTRPDAGVSWRPAHGVGAGLQILNFLGNKNRHVRSPLLYHGAFRGRGRGRAFHCDKGNLNRHIRGIPHQESVRMRAFRSASSLICAASSGRTARSAFGRSTGGTGQCIHRRICADCCFYESNRRAAGKSYLRNAGKPSSPVGTRCSASGRLWAADC
jgi:hypothetical protein